MKKSYYVLLAAVLVCLQPSCKKEIDDFGVSGTGEVENVTMEAKDLVYSDLNPQTKTSLSFKDNAAEFSWKSTDVVGVFPDEGTQVRFPIVDGHVEEGTTTSEAHFTGCGWAVKKQHSYMAYYPFVPDMNLDKTAIPVTFAGQVQRGNANSDHIEVFDYMAAALQEPTKTGEIAFHFEHLGCLFEFVIAAPKISEYTSLSLVSDGEFVVEGKYNLTAEVPAIVPTRTSHEVTLGLEGVATSTEKETIKLYMMLAPADLRNHNIKVMLKGPHAEFEKDLGAGTIFKAGKFYRPGMNGIVGGEIIQLEDGPAFCRDIKSLANGEAYITEKHDYNIEHILFEVNNPEAPEGQYGENFVDVSASDSPAPIYAIWDRDARTMTIRTGVGKVFMPRFVGEMFRNMDNLKDVDFHGVSFSQSNWFGDMFSGCVSLKSVDFLGEQFRNDSYFGGMFSGCESLEAFSIFPVGKVNAPGMFSGCSKLKTVDIDGWILGNTIDRMFENCISLQSVNILGADMSEVENMDELFHGCTSLSSVGFPAHAFISCRALNGMFAECHNLEIVEFEDSFGNENIRSFESVFSGCHKLKALDWSKITLCGVESFQRAFYGCTALETADVRNWVTTATTSIHRMFEGCSALKHIDISNWNTSYVTNFNSAFSGCAALKELDTKVLNTSSAEQLGYMFAGCSSLETLDATHFNTSKAKDMTSMFERCESLTSIDVSSFNTGNVFSFAAMFAGCKGLAEIKGIGDFDVHYAEDFVRMFSGCESMISFTLPWNTASMRSMGSMFKDCDNLKSVDLSTFDTSHAGMGYIFSGCSGLKVVKLGPKFVSSDPRPFLDSRFNGRDANIAFYCTRELYNSLAENARAHQKWFDLEGDLIWGCFGCGNEADLLEACQYQADEIYLDADNIHVSQSLVYEGTKDLKIDSMGNKIISSASVGFKFCSSGNLTGSLEMDVSSCQEADNTALWVANGSCRPTGILYLVNNSVANATLRVGDAANGTTAVFTKPQHGVYLTNLSGGETLVAEDGSSIVYE